MNLRRPLLVGLLAGTASLGAVPLAHAAFRDSATAASSFTAAQLAAPTGAGLSRTCVLVASATFTVTWTPSSSSWATGQEVELLNGLGVVVGTKTLGTAVTSTTFDVLTPIGSHTVQVRATYASWTAQTTASAPSC